MAAISPFAGNQVNPSIAMDADGDYAITWDGPGATANPFDPEDIRSDIDSQGVFVRTFHGQGLSEQNEAVTPETTVNTTLAGYQGLSSVAMTPDGSYVIDWAGNGVGSNDGIYVSRYTDPVDNSGPVLTGVELPSATNISSSLQVNSSVQAVVVTFDKDMLNDGSANSVTNVNNYKLLMNGVALSGGISKIYYGLNEGSIMAGQYGLSPNFAADNKYEAVVVLDGNGTAAGLVPLLNGQYQIVVKNSLRDAEGNPLSSSGFGPNGATQSYVFTVTVAAGGSESVVTPSFTSTTGPATASDGNGDYVVAWSDASQNHPASGPACTSRPPPPPPPARGPPAPRRCRSSIRPPARPGPTTKSRSAATRRPPMWPWPAASTAASSVTWSGDTRRPAGKSTPGSTTRPARAGTGRPGQPLGRHDAERAARLSVAMDAEGDFVVTWQSQNQSTGGYQIYAQAYNSSGQPLGGTDAVQDINFINGFAGAFELSWTTGDSSTNPVLTSGPIAINGNAAASVAAVKNALTAMGADVNVTATSLTSLEIDSVALRSLPQTQLWVAPAACAQCRSRGQRGCERGHGRGRKSGEFLANSATQSKCVQPDVAMDAAGRLRGHLVRLRHLPRQPHQGNIFAVRYSYNSSVMQPVVVPTPSRRATTALKSSPTSWPTTIRPTTPWRPLPATTAWGRFRHRGRQRLLGKLLAAGGHRLGAQCRPRGLERYDRGPGPRRGRHRWPSTCPAAG